MKRTSRIAAACGLALATVAGSALAESKIAVIDMQTAIVGTNEGARAIDTLQKLSASRQKELDAKQTALGKEELDLQKKCKSLPREQCDKQVEELLKKKNDFQTLMGDYQKEIQKKQQEATAPILNKMLAIVKRLAQKDGYDVVLEKQFAHFERADLDLTDAAVKLYNSESNVQPLPPSSAPKGAAPKAPVAPAPPAKK